MDVTPNRKTHVVFDDAEYALVQPAYSYEKQYNEFARSTSAQLSNVEKRQGIGWTLRHYADAAGVMMERTEGATSYLDSSALTVGDCIAEINSYRSLTNSEAPNVNPDSGVQSTGAPRFKKFVSGGNWDTGILTADQTAFPSPVLPTANYPMDRVIHTNATYQALGAFAFSFNPLAAPFHSTDGITTFYFPGPAGETKDSTGTGQYAVHFCGDGRAFLLEKDANTGLFVNRSSFRYAAAGHVFGFEHNIRIMCSPYTTRGSGPVGSILIQCGAAAAPGLIQTLTNYAINSILGHDIETQTYSYAVPSVSSEGVASVDCPLRVDIRRDIRSCIVSIGAPHYYASGTLKDDVFTPSGLFDPANPFTLYWISETPGDSTFTCDLYNAETGAVLSPAVSADNFKQYNPPAWGTSGPPMSYYVKGSFTSSTDGSKTPIWTQWRISRDALLDITTTTPFELLDTGSGLHLPVKGALGYSITGQDRDPSHSMAMVDAVDFANVLPTLRVRSQMPIRIETEYDASDASKRVVLFRGYVNRVESERYPGGLGRVYPGPLAYRLSVRASGMWQRLQEQTFAGLQQTFYGPDGPYLVTDVVRGVLNCCGFGDDMIELPYSAVRLFGKGPDDKSTLNPLTNMADYLQYVISTYLGMFLTFDNNIGTYGKWRLVVPPTAPYTYRAAFVTTGPQQTDSSLRVPSALPSYPLASTLGDGHTYTSDAPVIPIFNEHGQSTLRSYPRAPEANFVHASCMGIVNPQGPASLSTVDLVNVKSYNFYPGVPTADPTSPDYLGRFIPLYYMNPVLAGQFGSEGEAGNALAWAARREYDLTCHGFTMASWKSPQAFITHELDSNRKRGFLYYDPVTIDGTPFLIRSENPCAEKDSQQFAMYEAQEIVF